MPKSSTHRVKMVGQEVCFQRPGVLDGDIAIGHKFLDELLEIDDASFFETIHAAADFDVGMAVVIERDGVFIDDFLWDAFAVDAHVLVVGHWGAEVVVLYVHAEVPSALARVGDDAVEVDFGVQHGDGGRACVARVVKLVTAGSAADVVYLFLLWVNIADEIGVGYLAVFGDLGLVDEITRDGSFDAVGGFCADTLEEASEFVGCTAGPLCAVGALSEGSEWLFIAGDGVMG
jgi:hypothetical protein